ncbi:hypothetical protein JDN40_14415 [Rhodomicrobium vannielii ATCC 17100]|uniref:hypothetical protein n=1 Tax=Rhodomicrobium vannielii TaxID=1069 RepID=UPI00191A60F0|nr:hypothetical protein [Rhodomicrobium vannielii]MBJ7535302.1 hypothetical protein [Rhodomicrobium vannielii ATCC 17100]
MSVGNGSLRDQLRDHPILYAFGAIWLLEAGMNTLYGYRRAGGEFSLSALMYAAVFLAIACVAAWLPTKLTGKDFNSGVASAARGAVLVALTLLCVALSQVAGWSVMGTTLADGAAKRENAGLSRDTVIEALGQARAERKALGVQPVPEAVQARIDAELGTVVRSRFGETVNDVSQGCKDASAAPSACGRVAKLRQDLATARRAAELDAKIDAGGSKVAAAPAVASGDPSTEVLARITGLAPNDVRFWFTVVLVAIIGLFANLGFAIVQWTAHNPIHGTGSAAKAIAADIPIWDSGPARTLPAPPVHREIAAAPEPARIVYVAPQPAPAAASTASAEVPASAVSAPASATPQTEAGASLTAAVAGGSDMPADREALARVADELVTFRAAALSAQEGGIVSEQDLWQRYQQWAGPRAVDFAAWATLFPVCAGLQRQDFGGSIHYLNVALRASARVH